MAFGPIQATFSELARVNDYAGLMAALQARADALRANPVKHLSAVPIKPLHRATFGATLTALGLVIVVVEDLEALERIRPQLVKRRRPPANAGKDADYSAPRKSRHSKANYRTARIRQAANQTPEHRSAIARTAANARWKRRRLARHAALARWTRRRQASAGE